MKHIYIYIAPVYFIYLLQNYCLKGSLSPKYSISFKLFVKKISILGLIVISVFFITFAPFYDQLGQVFSRMFPFKRGLCHAYWAPNIWALYNIADKALTIIFTKSGYLVQNSTASMTGGLVQEFSHSVLPDIRPLTTMVLTGVMMVPALIKLWLSKAHPQIFLRSVVICALTSFMFGWHVHEKAILMAIIPLSILSVMNQNDAKMFLLLSVVGHYSLFPLLYPDSLFFIKVLLLILYSTYAFHSLYKIYPQLASRYSFPGLNSLESLYVLGLAGISLYEYTLHRLLNIDKKLPFLPLLLTSTYCSIGVCYCWIKCYINLIKEKDIKKV